MSNVLIAVEIVEIAESVLNEKDAEKNFGFDAKRISDGWIELTEICEFESLDVNTL